MSGNVFTRKAYQELLDWKNRLASKYALLVEGARRVGKTFLLQDFASREYDSHINIDFSLKGDEIDAAKDAFNRAVNVAELLDRLQLIFSVRLIPGKSCLVFDEIQLFPTARQAIKSLVAFGKYHFIESGSLVGIKENVKDILVPSEEHKMKIHPLDFAEFLDATGESMIGERIRDCFSQRRPLGPGVHEKALRLFRRYMVVGGMPQSVEAYISSEDGNMEASDMAKREILSLYDSDIGKYAKGYASKVRAIFRTIPSALSKHEKKFHLSSINSNARMRRYENAFLWLADAMVANIAYNATSPEVGLDMNLENSSFKCYSLDTGLLLTQAMGVGRETDPRLLRSVLYDNLGINEGMFFENVVAQSLVASGRNLYFFSRKDQRSSENTMEIDFLVRNGIKICPVEVKSGNYRAHTSLDRFIGKYAKRLGTRYVVCTSDWREAGGITYLPIYMSHLL